MYFSDGYGLWLTIVNQQYLGAALVFYPNPVSCCDEGMTSTGTAFEYFGSSDGGGYVYQNNVGTSFDGEAIEAYINLAWDAVKSPRILKRFRAASIEMQGSSYAAINFGYQLGYGSSLIGQPTSAMYSTGFSVAVWDQFIWDSFIWDGRTLLPTDVSMTGTAENVQAILSSGTNYIASFNINSLIFHYSVRRGMRV